MKAPHPVYLAGVELEALGCALRDRQPVAVSGLRIIELAGTATAAAREIRELRAQLEASQVEVQGMRAALDGHAGTHSPYLWTGPAEHHSAWLSGQQAVQKYGADRYQMGFEKAQEVAAVTAEPALRAQAEAGGTKWNHWLPGEQGQSGVYADDYCEGGYLHVWQDSQGDVYFQISSTPRLSFMAPSIRMTLNCSRRPQVFQAATRLAAALTQAGAGDQA